MEPICNLPASGFTQTPPMVLEWVDRAVADAWDAFQGAAVVAYVWAYRHSAGQYLACDIWHEAAHDGVPKKCFGITFVVGVGPDFSDAREPWVADMADALHMAGIVLMALGARVTLGRLDEVNQDAQAAPCPRRSTEPVSSSPKHG